MPSPRHILVTPGRRWLWPVLITLLAAALRFIHLGHDSLWFDEALTRNTAIAGPAAALAMRDHVPLLYWLVGLSVRLLGDNEVALRLPSALAGVLAVPLLIAFARATRMARAGLWAGLLLAVSPLAVRHAQEARHYALLLFFSLLTLYWLYRALNSPRPARAWLFFAVATVLNLLTHYSAWLWLAGQGVAAGLWLVWRGRGAWPAAARAAWPAVLVIGAALALLAGPAAEALRANTESAAGTTAAASLGTWLRVMGLEFGFISPVPAAILALLAVIGGLLLARRRPLAAWLLAVSAVVPVALIQLLGITRFALPKYVLYLLPLYLFAAGVAIDAGWRWLAARRPAAARAAVVGLAGLALAVGLPAVGREWQAMVHDWRGAAAQLGTAAAGDVALTIALDTGDGFNAAGIMAPFYLDPGFRLLDGNHLSAADVSGLAGQRGRVSALALNLYAPVMAGPGWAASHHVDSLYALRREAGAGDVLEQLAALYSVLIPQAVPAAQCDLWLRLATVELGRGATDAAAEALAGRAADCPTDATARQVTMAVGHAQLAAAVAAGDAAAADRLAAALLADDPRDAAALAVLTVADVLALFAAGEVTVEAAQSPEPVEIRQFEMPADGDRGEVLFAHPPADVSFTVALPDEPTVLRFRVALDPQSWEWGGDGVTFVVVAQPQEGEARELWRRHVPNDESGRRWQAIELPLAEFAGQTVTFTLATEIGPAGDGTGDWAGWESPRILRVAP